MTPTLMATFSGWKAPRSDSDDCLAPGNPVKEGRQSEREKGRGVWGDGKRGKPFKPKKERNKKGKKKEKAGNQKGKKRYERSNTVRILQPEKLTQDAISIDSKTDLSIEVADWGSL